MGSETYEATARPEIGGVLRFVVPCLLHELHLRRAHRLLFLLVSKWCLGYFPRWLWSVDRGFDKRCWGPFRSTLGDAYCRAQFSLLVLRKCGNVWNQCCRHLFHAGLWFNARDRGHRLDRTRFSRRKSEHITWGNSGVCGAFHGQCLSALCCLCVCVVHGLCNRHFHLVPIRVDSN